LELLAATQIDRKLLARSSPSDVVQETFLEAHRDFAQFRGESLPEFLAWLRRILVNNLSRLVERHVLTGKRDVRRETSLEGMEAALERSTARLESVLVDQGASPSTSAQRREYAIILADQLAELPHDYRDVLVLRHLEGLPFGEVAARMDRSPGAVRMLWLRAIGQLRERLDAQGLI
jgi:RNA polymerase sigma-70 factor (ECF subfamily)